MAAVFARHMTTEEAIIAAEFYDSTIGRRLMKVVSGNYSPDAVLTNIDTERDVTQAELDQDINTAVSETFNDLTDAEKVELERVFAANPSLSKLATVQPELRALRLEMENEPMTPEADNRINTMVETVLSAVSQTGKPSAKTCTRCPRRQ